MNRVRLGLRHGIARVERLFDLVGGPAWNPLYHLGALGFLFFCVTALTGLYLFGIHPSLFTPYPAAETILGDAYSLSRIMHSLHRYAADSLVAVALVHLAREFSLGRIDGARWLSWISGLPIVVTIYASGVTGLWLVGDRTSTYIEQALTDWFGSTPVPLGLLLGTSGEGSPLAVLIIHFLLPLGLLTLLWHHLQRLARPHCRPPDGLAGVMLLLLLGSALLWPISADHNVPVTTPVEIDWLFLAVFRLADEASPEVALSVLAALVALLVALPWLGQRGLRHTAAVNLALCNGCGRCVDDCPYNAITLARRSDHRPFAEEAVIDPGRCVGCGLCVAACPTSVAFHPDARMPAAIDLRRRPLRALRDEAWRAGRQFPEGAVRIIVFGCEHSVDPRSLRAAEAAPLPGPATAAAVATAGIPLPCIGMLPPSLIDYVLSRNLADGVMLSGCPSGSCRNRCGTHWAEQRLDGRRDPVLRRRVPRERVALCWAEANERPRLELALTQFARRLEQLPPRFGDVPASQANQQHRLPGAAS